jgi:hypothetical protein
MSAQPPDDNLAADYAMAHIAHTIRTYYLALKAEGFTTIEAIAIASNYQAALLGTAASMPPLPSPDTA